MSITTPREVLHTQIATGNAESPVGAEIMANAQGRSRATNETVQVSTNQADLTDALEELGQARSHFGKRDIEKMKLRRGAGTDLEALGRIADYYDKLPNLPTDQKSRDLVQKLQSYEDMYRQGEREGEAGNLPTAEDILKLLQEYDGDITHQFAMLENIRLNMASQGANEDFLSVLDEVRATLREGDGAQEIIAGFAAAREAVTAADRFSSSAMAFRDSYRQLVRSSGHMGRTFDALSEFSRLGGKTRDDFEGILDSFIKVAGDDMKSFGRSVEPVVLNAVVQELTVLKNLRTALEMTDGMISNLTRMFPDDSSKLPDSTTVASDLFHFVAGHVASSVDAAKMLSKFETGNPEVPVIAINSIRDIHGRLPDSVMPTETARVQQNQVLMAVSDKYVQAEEASYAQS